MKPHEHKDSVTSTRTATRLRWYAPAASGESVRQNTIQTYAGTCPRVDNAPLLNRGSKPQSQRFGDASRNSTGVGRQRSLNRFSPYKLYAQVPGMPREARVDRGGHLDAASQLAGRSLVLRGHEWPPETFRNRVGDQ